MVSIMSSEPLSAVTFLPVNGLPSIPVLVYTHVARHRENAFLKSKALRERVSKEQGTTVCICVFFVCLTAREDDVLVSEFEFVCFWCSCFGTDGCVQLRIRRL